MVARLFRSIWFTVLGGITSFQLKLAEPQTGCLNQAKTSEMIIAVATMMQNQTQQFQWGIRFWRFSTHRSEFSLSDSPDSESATGCGEYLALAMPRSAEKSSCQQLIAASLGVKMAGCGMSITLPGCSPKSPTGCGESHLQIKAQDVFW